MADRASLTTDDGLHSENANLSDATTHEGGEHEQGRQQVAIDVERNSTQMSSATGSTVESIDPTTSGNSRNVESEDRIEETGEAAPSVSSSTQQTQERVDDTPRTDTSELQQTTSSNPFSAPDTETRRGTNGFSALVEAFMNGFRQSMAAATAAQSSTASSIPATTDSDAPSTSHPATTQSPTASGSAAETVVDRQQETDVPSVPSEQNESDASSTQPAQSEQRNRDGDSNPTANDSSSNNARTLFFRMPFMGQDGAGAVLAFNPGPIPVPPAQQTSPPQFGPERPPELSPERGNGQASGYHLPVAPIFVPLGASPLPFSFLFDTQVNTAWPIASISYGPPGAMPPENPNPDLPQFVAGPPFHIALNISFGPPPEPERPDPDRARRFVASLEQADAELRGRMARLGMGDIGDYGGRQDNETGADAALGCGICLDEYPDEDRPEWIGGQESVDEVVVAVPCAGHHTLHNRCLYEWLAHTPPSQWTCPFCRAPLDKARVDESAERTTSASTTTTAASPAAEPSSDSDDLKKAQEASKARTLREEIRLRERARGWRCDSPACLPRYPDVGSEKNDTCDAVWPASETSLIALLPCRHQMHVDCLCTSMRLEQLSGSNSSDEEDEWEEEIGEEEEVEAKETTSTSKEDEKIVTVGQANKEVPQATRSPATSKPTRAETVGKWVTCPLCRHEAWAELPVRQRPRRKDTTAV